MTTKTNSVFLVLSLCAAMLAGCSLLSGSPAPVSERSLMDQPVRKMENGCCYTVMRGDNLFRIALDFGQSYNELVVWNGLADPHDIKAGQVLRVIAPDNGAKTTSVVVAGVEKRPLPPSSGTKTSPKGEKQPYPEASASKTPKPVATENVSLIWPTEGRVVSNFNNNKKGIDIEGKMGQPVLAAGAGKVMYAGSGIRGYGNLVIIRHASTLLSAYAHNKKILVKEEQMVTKGQKIAEMGNSDTDSVKLHFEIRRQGNPVDPVPFLPSR